MPQSHSMVCLACVLLAACDACDTRRRPPMVTEECAPPFIQQQANLDQELAKLVPARAILMERVDLLTRVGPPTRDTVAELAHLQPELLDLGQRITALQQARLASVEAMMSECTRKPTP